MMESNSAAIGFPRLDYFTVTSTLDIAREQAGHGAPHGTLITASHQTAGRGRRGASWQDEPGASALMTFILRPEKMQMADAWRIPFLASLACVRALQSAGFAEARVKWPNDLVLGVSKVGGILVETFGGETAAYLLGIGINVSQEQFGDSGSFPIQPISLRMAREGQACPNTTDIIAAVSTELNRAWLENLSDGEALIENWRAYQMTGQRQIGVDVSTGASSAGVYTDVRPDDGAGLLRIEGQLDLVAVMPAVA